MVKGYFVKGNVSQIVSGERGFRMFQRKRYVVLNENENCVNIYASVVKGKGLNVSQGRNISEL